VGLRFRVRQLRRPASPNLKTILHPTLSATWMFHPPSFARSKRYTLNWNPLPNLAGNESRKEHF
jgi:hypothetical protein